MMSDKPVSPYILKHPLRDLCPHCRERPREPETELCEECQLFALYEEMMEGDER